MIQACADKLKNEVGQFGFPPIFPGETEEEEEDVAKEAADPADPTKRTKRVLTTLCDVSIMHNTC